jgi:hypothetical protein
MPAEVRKRSKLRTKGQAGIMSGHKEVVTTIGNLRPYIDTERRAIELRSRIPKGGFSTTTRLETRVVLSFLSKVERERLGGERTDNEEERG